MSKSVAKAPRAGIGCEKKRGISTFLFRRSGAIGAFATDLDKLRPRGPLAGMRPTQRRPQRAPRRPDGTREYTARRSDGPCLRSPERLLRRKVHFAFESAVPTVILECKMHISTRKGVGVVVLADRGAGPALEHLRRPGEKCSVRCYCRFRQQENSRREALRLCCMEAPSGEAASLSGRGARARGAPRTCRCH